MRLGTATAKGWTKGKKNPKGKKGQKKSTKTQARSESSHLDLNWPWNSSSWWPQWFPNEEIIVSGDSAYGGQSILSHLPPNVHLISHVHPNGALYEPGVSQERKMQGPAGKKKGTGYPA